MYLSAGLMLAGMLWGGFTSIGLFRRDRWSRISILIFSCMMAATCLLSLVVVLFIPLPAPSGSPPPVNIRLTMVGFYGVFATLGVIWALYFTRPGVKAEFGLTGPRTDPRPLSIVIIGWWLAVSSFFVLLPLLLRLPAYLLGLVLEGWYGVPVHLVTGAVCFYIGTGLLRLDRRAFQVAIGYFLFGMVNSATMLLLPDRYMRIMNAMPKWIPLPPPHGGYPSLSGFTLGVVIATVSILVPLWFLITRRAAFAPRDAVS